ncbi:MAG: helix-turn-helix transcriptional regulator [Calditrichaeota bacterium]|nr:helix-turn-helix transcriptional regulator [Calditrichota bacterium]
MTYRDAFGKILKRLREERGLSQSKLASMAGLSHTFIGQLERGDRCPTIDTVFMLAKVLEVKAAKIIEEIEK